MLNGVSSDAEDFGCCIHLIYSVGASQLPCGDLPRRSFLVSCKRSESKRASRPCAQHSADYPLLPHAQANQ